MAIFAIIGPYENVALNAAVERLFSERFNIAPGQWMVSAQNTTTREIADKIGTNEQNGQYVVLAVANWWGYHRKDLWEWLQSRPTNG